MALALLFVLLGTTVMVSWRMGRVAPHLLSWVVVAIYFASHMMRGGQSGFGVCYL